ncbi:MAG: DUF3500 domain-containing protein, partial [Rubricoccaceae bacterium]|nr:DUF3500 domain-containing protein [Rubricoccaceae bacterium]
MRLTLLLAVFLLGGFLLIVQPWATDTSQQDPDTQSHSTMPASVFVDDRRDDMADAAVAFLGSLSHNQRATAQFPFDAAERTNWHYVPRTRGGLPFSGMSDMQ